MLYKRVMYRMTHALENNRNVARIMLDTIRAKYTFPHSSFLIPHSSFGYAQYRSKNTAHAEQS